MLKQTLIYQYVMQGHSQADAALHFGVAQSWISRAVNTHCKKMGLVKPDRRVKK